MNYFTSSGETKIGFRYSGIIMLFFVLFATTLAFTAQAGTLSVKKENEPLQSAVSNTKTTNTGHFIGTMNNIVIFIRFADQDEFTESYSFCDSFFNNSEGLSVKHYYAENSNNKLTINSRFYPAGENNTIISYQDKHPQAYYEPYNPDTNPIGYEDYAERGHYLARNAIASVKDELEASGLNFDLNNDGLIDNICFLIQKDEGPYSICLYPHIMRLYSEPYEYIGGKKVWGYHVHTTEYFSLEQLGFLCHEMFHAFAGAPDLYNSHSIAFSPVGIWDLMGNLTAPPAHFLVYTKMKYGTWLESIPQISTPGTYTLESISTNPFAAYEIPSPNSPYEKFIVEYRIPEGIFESGLKTKNSEHGLIIYRVDSRKEGGNMGPPYGVYVFRPLYGDHPEEGNDDKAGFAVENGRTMFNRETNPSCFLNDGSDGGIFIANITSNQGETISFDLIDPNNIVSPTALFSADITSGGFPLMVTFTENSSGFPTSFSWDFGDGNVSTERHPVHTYTSPGTYSVSLTVSNIAGTDVTVKTDFIAVNKKDQSITFTEPTEAIVNDAITLNASASSGLEVIYAVVSGEATLASDGKTVTFNEVGNVGITAKQEGNYEYYPAQEQTITVTVTAITGINDISEKGISIYPNPIRSILNIKADKCYEVQLIDILGKLKLQRKMENNSTIIDVSHLSSGIYILHLVDGNKKIINQIVLKN